MLDTVIFELAGRPVLLLDLICSVLGLTCVFLAGRNSKYNFWVGYLYTAALFLLFMHRNLYASLLLQPVSLVINMLGHYRWTHPKPEETSDGKTLKSALKKWDCWIAWLLVNITQIALHLSVGNLLMSIVSALYLVNGIWSLITWVRLMRGTQSVDNKKDK